MDDPQLLHSLATAAPPGGRCHRRERALLNRCHRVRAGLVDHFSVLLFLLFLLPLAARRVGLEQSRLFRHVHGVGRSVRLLEPPPRRQLLGSTVLLDEGLQSVPGLQKRICSKLKFEVVSKYQRTSKIRNIMSPHIPGSPVKAPWKLRESCCILGKSRKILVKI